MKKLFVGNLAFQVTEAELRELFEQAGEIESVNLITDRETGRSRGFAFVEYTTDEAAQEAIQRFNGTELGGRPLRVDEARERSSSRSEGRRNRY
ncbi:MAG: RNA-binding protein [Anaerolineae bacterium]|nr:RNA-binding protein [Anaerolineae bacterium]